MSRNPISCPHCGVVLKEPRSIPQHRRYFSVIAAVFHHWPETADRQFASVEECRKYLQMKAGWREVGASIPLTGMGKERAMMLAEAAIRGAGSYAVPVIHGDTLVIFKPKSIAFDKLGHAEFCALNNAVDEVIRVESGLDPEKLLLEHERAA